MPLQELTRELVEAIARQQPTLQSLTLARNALHELRFLELLARPLRRLDVSANRVRSLPNEIAQWGAALQFLDLSDNALESLQQLRACRDLEVLLLGGNKIALFSEAVHLQALPRLRELSLERNPIASQPTYRQEIIAMLPTLETLDGRPITQVERLFVSLQQKPRLTIDTGTAPPYPESLADAGPEEADTPRSSQRVQELDLSGASHAWSSHPPLSLPSPSSSASCDPVASVPDVPVLLPPTPSPLPSPVPVPSPSPLPRPRLLTPAKLRSTAALTPILSRADAAVQAELDVKDDTQTEATRRSRDAAQLLQTRISALESILSLQDSMLQDGLVRLGKHQDPSKASDLVESAARVYTKLLATWRQKVLSLMVQLNSVELQRAGQEDVRAHGRDVDDQISQLRDELQRQVDVWKQKCADAVAQRDLERVLVEKSRSENAAAQAKIVKVVRTLAAERDRVRWIAEEVAIFSAKENAMTIHMDALAHATQRLVAHETRLRLLSERLQLASRLVAHREARLRNEEAAIEAERRVWNQKLAATERSRTNCSDATLGHGPSKPRRLLLRPTTERAVRLLFHRLDPYHTGLVRTSALLGALASDLGVRSALGGNDSGSDRQKKLVEFVEKALKERAEDGMVGGTITWGELLLVFVPDKDRDGDAAVGAWENEVFNCASVPPPFEEVTGMAAQASSPTGKDDKADRQALQTLTKQELVRQVLALRRERDQLQRRVVGDANRLQRRVRYVASQWEKRVGELASANEELHRKLRKESSRTADLERKVQDAERSAGETRHQLQSMRRQLSEQAAEFAVQKERLERRCAESVEQEQQVWRRELQDASFQQSQLQAEKAKLELNVRQLEREIARQREQREQNEAARVAHLEDKVRKRDEEIAKLRRERNTTLNALRDQERKLAQLEEERAMRADASTQTARPQCMSAETQTSKAEDERGDRRLRVEDMARAEPQPGPRAAPVAAKADARALHERLRHLEAMTQSLLAE